MKIGDKYTLPKGTPVGMGKLKAPAQGTIIKADKSEDGTPIYCVRFLDAQQRTRFTWITEPEPKQGGTLPQGA